MCIVLASMISPESMIHSVIATSSLLIGMLSTIASLGYWVLEACRSRSIIVDRVIYLSDIG